MTLDEIKTQARWMADTCDAIAKDGGVTTTPIALAMLCRCVKSLADRLAALEQRQPNVTTSPRSITRSPAAIRWRM